MKLLRTLLATAAAAAIAPGTASADRVVLSSGHVDAVAPVLADHGMALRVKDGTAAGPAVLREPDDVLLQVRPQARTTVPDDPTFAFLGRPGSDVWILPQSSHPDLLWAGWSSERIPAGTFTDDTLKWTLQSVDGPGPVQLYEAGAFGQPRVLFNSADGLPDSHPRAIGTHAHFNWAFSAPGMYTLNFTVAGTRGGSDELAGANYKVFVGDLADLPPELIYIDGLELGYDAGATARLVARKGTTSRYTDFRWLRQCDGEDAPREVATGETYAFTVTRAHDACRLTIALRDDAGRELLRSDEALVSVRSGSWGPRVILSQGHADALEVALEGTALKVRLNDDSGDEPVLRRPQDVLLHAKPQSRFRLSEDLPPEYAFLGKPGDTIYLLPEVQDSALLWPGWDTEGVPIGAVEGDALRFRLLSVDGPGALQLFSTNAFGAPEVIFDSADGLPDATAMLAHAHVHASWAFSKPGLYKLRFDVAGRTSAGQPVDSGPVEYWFYVGDLAELPAYPDEDATPTPSPEPTPTPEPGTAVTPPVVLAPAPTPTPAPTRPATRPTLRVTSAKLAGRTLTLSTRLSTHSRVTVSVRRGSRTVARAKPRTVSASSRALKVKLDRRLAAGRYSVRVSATADGRTVTRTIALRVR